MIGDIEVAMMSQASGCTSAVKPPSQAHTFPFTLEGLKPGFAGATTILVPKPFLQAHTLRFIYRTANRILDVYSMYPSLSISLPLTSCS
jgi:hypothetical protein